MCHADASPIEMSGAQYSARASRRSRHGAKGVRLLGGPSSEGNERECRYDAEECKPVDARRKRVLSVVSDAPRVVLLDAVERPGDLLRGRFHVRDDDVRFVSG